MRKSISNSIIEWSNLRIETSKSRCSLGFNSWITTFLVYINDICSNLSANVKLLADATSRFSIANDANKCFQNLSNDLCIISNWAYQWKMSFNPDRSKQAQEVIFSRKRLIQPHPVLTFDNSPVIKTTHQKHFILDEKNSKEKMSEAYKEIENITGFHPKKFSINNY